MISFLRWRCSRRRWFHSCFVRLSFGVAVIYIYCEYLIYFVTQIQCGWPLLTNSTVNIKPVYAMVIADPHLASTQNGDWYNKWRHEKQMQRVFQTAITLHNPDAVFILGDIFDEGKSCPEEEFDEYVKRFHEIFKVPEKTSIYTVAGNHDIGFHYSKNLVREFKVAGPKQGDLYRRITPHLVQRFENKMNTPSVQLVSIRGNHFVLINSMAMEGDGCSLCSHAVNYINNISDIFKCSSGSALCKGKTKFKIYSRPIIMQHFPFYRESDSICTELDAAPFPERSYKFEERMDCLSKESSEFLVDSLRPRAALGGHTHHSCVVRHSFVPTSNHKIEFTEYTVPSFSRKNRLVPKYYLLTSTPEEIKLSKCSLHRDSTTYCTFGFMVILLIIYLSYFNTKTNRSY